jgi:hypothetical protein
MKVLDELGGIHPKRVAKAHKFDHVHASDTAFTLSAAPCAGGGFGSFFRSRISATLVLRSWRFLGSSSSYIFQYFAVRGLDFRKQIDVMGIQEVLSAPRSPWQRAYVERVIGSIRRECLDHVIVFDQGSLRCMLRSYFRYYHRSRLHLSLNKDSPDSRPVQSVGEVISIPEVGGLQHRYERRTA